MLLFISKRSIRGQGLVEAIKKAITIDGGPGRRVPVKMAGGVFPSHRMTLLSQQQQTAGRKGSSETDRPRAALW